jgi:hypothetical protein
MKTTYSWILDSGGAGRGAWQGGVIYEFMRWCRDNNCVPSVTMGASVGGYAAADIATGTEQTVMKGWNYWGTRDTASFRHHLHSSIVYVMTEPEMSGVFDENPDKKLLIFTTRVRRKDGKPFTKPDNFRFFLKSLTRKFPSGFKYIPHGYVEDPVVFATNLFPELHSPYIRPLTRKNYYAAIEASCLIPFAMGAPIHPESLCIESYPDDDASVFIDGGYSLKMPMRIFEEDPRFQGLAQGAHADKSIIFCCDPKGCLWETSSRLNNLAAMPALEIAISENRLLIVYPDHPIEAGFLCMDHEKTMRTFQRGREQAEHLLRSDQIRKFFFE